MSRNRLPVQDQRSRTPRRRSTSRPHYPYTSNCSRRRWPPSPKVEEVKYEEEIPMRGKIGQNPMIIDVPSSTGSDSGSTFSKDSDESTAPETPPTDSDNRNRRYVWKPESDGPIPQAYGKVRGPIPPTQKNTNLIEARERGRKPAPKLDTDLARSKSTGGPPPNLERARSPYASGPQDRKPKPDRFSGEYLLSPDVMSPRKPFAESPRSHSQHYPRQGEARLTGRPGQGREVPTKPVRPSMESHRTHSQYIAHPVEFYNTMRDARSTVNHGANGRPSPMRRASELPYPDDSRVPDARPALSSTNSRHLARPTVDKRDSELPYPTTPPSANTNRPHSRRPPDPVDDPDGDHARFRHASGQLSPQYPSRHSPMSSNGGRHHERKFSSELSTSLLKRSLPSSDGAAPPVNLSSLVSGTAITQTLNSVLDGDHAAARRASPRSSPRPSPGTSPVASPHGSPKTSPYSSPPRTPPSGSFQYRPNPIAGLKKDSPSSRPSSPLSSRSSTWTADPEPSPLKGEHCERSRPGPLTSRKTAPLPSSHLEKSKEAELLDAPGIVVRSPSPANHKKSFLGEMGETQHCKANYSDEMPDHRSRSSNLRPTVLSGRTRSASSSDVRPQLTVTPPFLQSSDSSLSPHSRPGPSSPSLPSPSERYKPSNLDPENAGTRSRSLRHEGISSSNRARSRSRSYVPEPVATGPTTKSSSLESRAPLPRSRSTMPTPAHVSAQSPAPKTTSLALSPIAPADLPKCPRPQAVTGYDDWSTLQGNTAFAICPTCRDGIFGSNYRNYLQPRPETSRKTLCDLNNPWVRLALSLRGPDVKLLSALSDVTYNERSCPGDELARRDWYRLEDSESGKHISGVNVCPHCVRSLEALLPAWRNVFYRSHSSHSHEHKDRFCALRSSPMRFGDYLNMMVDLAQEADNKRKALNTTPVCDLAKQLAAIDECPKDKMFPRKAWHIHPHLPEFTICQECYENVVYPLTKDGWSLASKIDTKPHQLPNPEIEVCCHLYSPRMRKVFKEACEDDDYEHLRHTVLKRHMLQQDILGTFRELRDHPGDSEVTDRLGELLDKWKGKE